MGRKKKKLNFLVVNDDGIMSPGMAALVKALGERGDVYVCAPDGERSAQSQAITIKDPIRVYPFEYKGAKEALATTGTPTDCTKVGLQFFKEQRIEMDMVFSGINIGSNFGKDTLYSGTIGAAMEAALSNVRAVAVSVDSHTATHFDAACDTALAVIDKCMEELTPDIILNINAPDIPREEVRGIRYTALGERFYIDSFIKNGEDDGGSVTNSLKETKAHDSYMLEGEPIDLNDIDERYDVTATMDGYVSVTPLQFDYTAYEMIDKVASWDLDSVTGFSGAAPVKERSIE